MRDGARGAGRAGCGARWPDPAPDPAPGGRQVAAWGRPRPRACAAGAPDADVHFVSGGTQANLICLNSMLRSYDSVIAVESGHIYVHETGAIEATGHKVHALPTKDGTIMPEQVQALVDAHTDEHMVHPRALFISNSTEVGTIYRKADLEALSAVCRRNGLYLYLDGARLGSALTSRESDVTLADLARGAGVHTLAVQIVPAWAVRAMRAGMAG